MSKGQEKDTEKSNSQNEDNERVDIQCWVDNTKSKYDIPVVQVSIVRKLEMLFAKENKILYEKTLKTVNFLKFLKGIGKKEKEEDRKKLCFEPVEKSLKKNWEERMKKLNDQTKIEDGKNPHPDKDDEEKKSKIQPQ